MLLLLLHHVGVQGRWGWKRTLIRELDGGSHDLADFPLELYEIGLGAQVVPQNRRLQHEKRVAFAVILYFFFGSVVSVCRI